MVGRVMIAVRWTQFWEIRYLLGNYLTLQANRKWKVRVPSKEGMEWNGVDWDGLDSGDRTRDRRFSCFSNVFTYLLLNFLFSFSNCVSKQRKHFVAKATHSWLEWICHSFYTIPANSPSFPGSLQVFHQISREIPTAVPCPYSKFFD